MRLTVRKLRFADRSPLADLLDHANKTAYPAAVAEFRSAQRSSFDAIGNILILGEAILPGYLMSVIEGDWPNRRDEIIEALERENPYRDDVILDWLSTEAGHCPHAFNYMVQLDALRRMALICVRG